MLGRIGLAYLFAALIALHTRPRNQFLTAIGLLLGYWAALKFIPVPGFPTGSLFPGETVGDYIDRHILPGHLYKTRPRSGGVLLDDSGHRHRALRRDGRALAAPARSAAERKAGGLAIGRRREPGAGLSLEHGLPLQQELVDQLVRAVDDRLEPAAACRCSTS